MIIQIHIKDKVIENLKNAMIKFIKFVYGWISKDNDFLGHVLGVAHFMIAMLFYILFIACHTVYPSLYFQIFVFSCIFIIWLQHVFLRVCISIIAEKELTQYHAPSITLFEFVLDYMNITFEQFTNYILIAETTAVAAFGLELLSKLSVFLYKKYDVLY